MEPGPKGRGTFQSGQSCKTFYACKLQLKSRNIGNFLVSTTLES